MQPPEYLLQWHFSFDNPAILGWVVVAASLCAAVTLKPGRKLANRQKPLNPLRII